MAFDNYLKIKGVSSQKFLQCTGEIVREMYSEIKSLLEIY